MNIAITGISGYIGQLLLNRLAFNDIYDKVVGIDINDLPSTTRKDALMDLYRAGSG